MARIARRSLRITSLPLFSLGEPWRSVANKQGELALRLFEPRYLELARRVLPPAGNGDFGYSEGYPPRVGDSGVLARIGNLKWSLDLSEVHIVASCLRRFRVLGVREEQVEGSQPPLYVGHVQLLEDRDVARGTPQSAWNYWTSSAPGQQRTKADAVVPGTTLVANQLVHVFESATSWKVIATMPRGSSVLTVGRPSIVEGYLMVPIAPTGAVELNLFVDNSVVGHPLMSEKTVQETLRRITKSHGGSTEVEKRTRHRDGSVGKENQQQHGRKNGRKKG